MDIKDIEKYYERASDSKLIQVVTTDAYGLTPEALDIIEREIKKRNLDPTILKAAKDLNKRYTGEEVEKYSELIRVFPCPICGSNSYKLNGTIVYKVESFGLFSRTSKEPIIACPPCLDKKNNNAIISTALLGWWCFPWGIFYPPAYIYRNIKAKEHNRVEQPNEVMLSFTLTHIQQFETHKEDKEKLVEEIKRRIANPSNQIGKSFSLN